MPGLCELRPHIVKFYRAVEGNITKKVYLANPKGRRADGLIFITEGKMKYSFSDDTQIEVKAGEILFLPKGSVYRMDLLGDNYRFIFADFDFSDSFKSAEVYHMLSSKGVHSSFRKMLEKCRQKKPGAEEDCLSILYSIYAEIIRMGDASYISPQKRAQLDRSLQFISEHYMDEGLTVTSAAASASMSESNYRRIFKEFYRISPIKYITLIRIDRAKEQIRYTSDSFSKIAVETGFSNLYYFSRIFKKEVGCTPSEYREAYGDGAV